MLIRKLKELGYKMFVLSNTNAIHIRSFNRILESAHGYKDLDELFDKAYYSHHLNMRKPEASIFERVLFYENLYPEKTLFLDDTEANIETANRLNLHTLYVTPQNSIVDIFKPLTEEA